MVDSGSDVATVRHEILEKLDLEPIASIQSKGVHATIQTMMYKAKLQVGKEEVEVEVGIPIKLNSFALSELSSFSKLELLCCL